MITICIATLLGDENLKKLLTPLFFEGLDFNDFQNTRILVLAQEVPARFIPDRRVHISNVPENHGCGGARQLMVDMSLMGMKANDIFVFLDDDIEVTDKMWLCQLTYPINEQGANICGVEGMRITPDYLTVPERDNPDYVSGGWCAIGIEVFNDGVSFDPRFFPNYFEDVDLCLQARAAGHRIAIAPQVGLKHDHTGQGNHDIFERSRQAFRAKWSMGLNTLPYPPVNL